MRYRKEIIDMKFFYYRTAPLYRIQFVQNTSSYEKFMRLKSSLFFMNGILLTILSGTFNENVDG